MKPHLVLLAAVLVLGSGLGFDSRARSGSPCASLEYRQFDFWVGDWEVFDFTGGVKGAVAGTNKVVKLFVNCVIQEHWQGSQGGNGSSFSTYQPLERRWHQTWVDDGGTLLLLNGEFRDSHMVLEGMHLGDRPPVTVNERITWNVVNGNPDQVRQFGEGSRDGGKTWVRGFDLLYVRKN